MDYLYKNRFIKGLVIRFIIIIISDLLESFNIFSYSDIDYTVFTDGAYYVSKNQSPFKRETYRYSPIMAYVMLPNIYIHRTIGKYIFSICDVYSGYLIEALLRKQTKSKNENEFQFNSCLQYYNPLSIIICTRGSSDSLVIFIILKIVILIEENKIFSAGLLFGFAVHFRIYPIIYSLCLFFYILFKGNNFDKVKYIKNDNEYKVLTIVINFIKNGLNSFQFLIEVLMKKKKEPVLFVFVSVFIFLICNLIFYFIYGNEYIHEALLYHFIRKDHRHNYSLYNYMIYLTYTSSLSKIVSLLAFIPQMTLILVFSCIFFNNINFCLVLITMIFVHFNKVVTAQYFLWYFSLFPLIINQNSFFHKKKGMICFGLWFIIEGIWNYYAHLLEYKRVNTFREMFYIEVLFFGISSYIIKELVKENKFVIPNLEIDNRIN